MLESTFVVSMAPQRAKTCAVALASLLVAVRRASEDYLFILLGIFKTTIYLVWLYCECKWSYACALLCSTR